jgi:translocation and assembly module TamA
VHHLRFHGLSGVDVGELEERLAVEETSWVPWEPKRWLDRFALEGDRARVEAWLKARGYYAAQVVNVETHPWKRGGVDVDITVEPGPQVRVSEVVAPAGFAMKVGEPFDHDRYLAAKLGLVEALRAQGHAWPQVTGAVTVDPVRQTAQVHIEAVPGPPAVLGEIEVVGSTRIDPRLLVRHTGLRPGEPYRPERLEEARGRIYQLGAFAAVEVEPFEEPGGVARVRVTVHEAPANEIKLGAGVGIEYQHNDVHGHFAWVRHGLGGGLRRLRLSFDPAYVAMPAVWDLQKHGPAATTELELQQLDLPWRLSSITWKIGYDLGIDYAYQYHGPRTTLAFGQALWRDRVHVGVSYNFQFLNFFNTDDIFATPDSGPFFGYQELYRVGWFQEELSLDLRDRPLDPHRGMYVALGAEEGGVYAGGAFTYEKLTPQVRGYLPFGKRGTLAAEVQFGQMFSHGDAGSPITRRYYLGGATSHRGFAYNRLSPQAGADRVPVGGEQMFLGQLELRMELVRLGGYWLAAVMFADAGDVVEQGRNIDFTQLYWAVGGGLRYKTPLGTVRVDFAGRLNRLAAAEPNGVPNADPGQPFQFHFSFGEAF